MAWNLNVVVDGQRCGVVCAHIWWLFSLDKRARYRERGDMRKYNNNLSIRSKKFFFSIFHIIRSTPPNTTSCLALIGSRALVAFKTNSLLLLALVEFSACFCIVRARLFFMRRIFFNFHIAELYRHEVEIVVSLTRSLSPRYSGDTLGRVVKRQSWEEGALLWLQKAEKERESRN